MTDKLGDKLGPRFAAIIGQAVLAARRDHAPIEAQIRQLAAQGIIDRAGLEIGHHFAPFLLGAIDAHGDQMPAEVRQFFADTASGRHQWQAIAGASAAASTSALSQVISNYLAPFTYPLVALHPSLALDPQTAASAAAAGLVLPSEAQRTAAIQGFPASEAAVLFDLAHAIPDNGTLAQLVNRGLLPESVAESWLKRGAVPDALIPPISALRRAVLSPADAALAVTRSIFTQAEGERIAALSGMDAADFATLVANTGEPLGLEQLLEALRRGFIDGARFDVGFRQARYRNEWAPTALQLAYAPMSTADAVDAAIQGHLTYDQAKVKAVQNGLEAADFDALYQTAGEPISRTEAEQLYNRGLMTEAEVKQAIVESRLKPKYTGLAFDLHVRLPEGRQVVSMITHGVVTKQQGVQLLLQLGYSAEVAGFLVAEGTSAKLGAHKALTVAEIHSLYTAGVFTEAHAVQLLDGMGYDAADSAYLIRSWDLLAAAAITRQAIGVVRSKYVARHFDEQAANLYLDSLGVAPAAKTRYLTVWDIERQATVRTLTEAQTVKAHKDGLITGQDAAARLAVMGYDDADVHILLGVAPADAIPA